MTHTVSQLTAPADAASALSIQDNAVADVLAVFPGWVWALLPLCITWAFVRRERAAVLFTLWWAAIVLATNPQWLRLPGQGVIGNFTIVIAAYIPAGIWMGAALGWLLELLSRRPLSISGAAHTRAGQAGAPVALACLLLVCAAGLLGARQRLGDLQIAPHALATGADIKAAAWIRSNTPAGARFLVNTFLAYLGTTAVGSDGGWWLPLLAQRRTMLPPINYAWEPGPIPRYSYWINALPEEIQAKGIAHPDVLEMLHARGITHVYIGQQRGRVNYDGPFVLEPQALLASSAFRPVYHQDRVWVFEIEPPLDLAIPRGEP